MGFTYSEAVGIFYTDCDRYSGFLEIFVEQPAPDEKGDKGENPDGRDSFLVFTIGLSIRVNEVEEEVEWFVQASQSSLGSKVMAANMEQMTTAVK